VPLQFLYLVASGNNDSIYKVGISDDPNRRLEEIKVTYGVPKAFLVETMDVSTREEVFALENTLHTKFARRRSRKYGGKEFFKLSSNEIDWIRELFTEESNDFAQAKAYHSLSMSAAEIQEEALELEDRRQQDIRYNRRNGKTFDTKPAGVLKRYNQILKKLSDGHLGSRFSIRTREHPAKSLSREVEVNAGKIIDKRLSKHWLVSAGVSFLGALVICSSITDEEIVAYASSAAVVGAIGGGISASARSSKEKSKAKALIECAVDKRYPGLMTQTLTSISDSKKGQEFLVSDFSEVSNRLRNQGVVLPEVSLPSQQKIYAGYQGRMFFPKVAVTVGIGFAVMAASADSGNDERSYFQRLDQQPVKAEMYWLG